MLIGSECSFEYDFEHDPSGPSLSTPSH